MSIYPSRHHSNFPWNVLSELRRERHTTHPQSTRFRTNTNPTTSTSTRPYRGQAEQQPPTSQPIFRQPSLSAYARHLHQNISAYMHPITRVLFHPRVRIIEQQSPSNRSRTCVVCIVISNDLIPQQPHQQMLSTAPPQACYL